LSSFHPPSIPSFSHGAPFCPPPPPRDFEALSEEDAAGNNQLAFDVAEREFGIQPVTTGKELASGEHQQQPDTLLLVLYLSRFYEAFRRSPGCNGAGEALLIPVRGFYIRLASRVINVMIT